MTIASERGASTCGRQRFELSAIEFGTRGKILQAAELAHRARLHQPLGSGRSETAHES